jgi:hypothetical protein
MIRPLVFSSESRSYQRLAVLFALFDALMKLGDTISTNVDGNRGRLRTRICISGRLRKQSSRNGIRRRAIDSARKAAFERLICDPGASVW